MSWHINPFVSRTKAGAVKHVEETYEKQKQYMPSEARDAVVAAIETLHVPENKGVLVKTACGHSDPHNGGNADVCVMTVDVVG